MRIYIICAINGAPKKYLNRLYKYAANLESVGNDVYLPPRDTLQTDVVGGGYNICVDNKIAIQTADEIHIFEYDGTSKGSLFDAGMAFAFDKKIKLVDCSAVDESLPKSFPKMLRCWEQKCNEKNN